MAKRYKDEADLRKTSGKCKVAVVYQDASSIDLAVKLCKRLASEFEGELEFDFSWWGFRYLHGTPIAQQAAEAAAGADILVVSIGAPEALPVEIRTWFDRWIPQRKAVEGALVVVPAQDLTTQPASIGESFLRGAAERANMDFLSLPRSNVNPGPSEGDFDELLEQRRHLTGWGINE
jgi:hypothetical protein